MYALYTLYICFIFALCTLCIRFMYALYTLDIRLIYALYTLYIRFIYALYTLDISFNAAFKHNTICVIHKNITCTQMLFYKSREYFWNSDFATNSIL